MEKIINIEFTPEFKRSVRALSKKNRHIRSDIQPLIEQLEKGEIVGDKIPGVKHSVFKLRVLNSVFKKEKALVTA